MKRFAVRLSTLLSVVLALLAGGALFWISQQVQMLEHEQRGLHHDIALEKEGIRVLDAEWDYLNRPDRLEALIGEHLRSMNPVVPENLLRDAKAVPQPDLVPSDNKTFLVSTEEEKKPAAGKKNTSRAVPDARPLQRPSSPANDQDFNRVLQNMTEGTP